MQKLFCSMLIILFWFTASHSCDTLMAAVTAYLRYDFDGERLESKASENIDKLTANAYEPAWDSTTLVDGYEVQSIMHAHKGAMARVLFKKAWEVREKFSIKSIKDEIIEMHFGRN